MQECYIQCIQSMDPPYCIRQSDGIAWLTGALEKIFAHDTPQQHKIIKFYERLGALAAIQQRHTVVHDYTHQNWQDMRLFKPWDRCHQDSSPWHSPPLDQRMQLFTKTATDTILEGFAETTEAPAYLIEISCTGYTSPSPGQILVNQKGWLTQTKLLRLGHMGCYAALPALHMAHQLLSANDDHRSISAFLCEFCTLHARPAITATDQMVTNILFADGSVRVDLGKEPGGTRFRLLDYKESMLANTLPYMSWQLGESAFYMSLAKTVPTLLRSVINGALSDLLSPHGISKNDISHFAIHPGGPKIIDDIQEALCLDDTTITASREVLRTRGNMSSATLPHIWQRIQDQPSRSKELIVSMGFGPGLTLAMSLMEKMPT